MTREPLTWVLLETPPWEHYIQLPGHSLARYLVARGHRVVYLGAPVSPWHFLSKSQRDAARKRWSAEGKHGQWREENLFTYIPRTMAPVNKQWPFDCVYTWRNSERWTFPRVSRLLAREGFGHPDVIVAHNLQLTGLFDALPHRMLVARVEDDVSGFPTMPRTIIEREGEVLSRADLVTVTAHGLESRARKLGGRHVIYMPNGVNTERFRRPKELPARPVELPPSPCAIYVGAIDSWFDEDLLDAVAEKKPDWNFFLVGPRRHSLSKLRQRSNVVIHDPIPQEKIPPYLLHADAGLIPFRRIPLIESVCPLKLFEYITAGLPVVATRWNEMEALQSPAVLAGSQEEFARGLDEALGASGRSRELGIAWAAKYSWERIFDRFMDDIYNHFSHGETI